MKNDNVKILEQQMPNIFERYSFHRPSDIILTTDFTVEKQNYDFSAPLTSLRKKPPSFNKNNNLIVNPD